MRELHENIIFKIAEFICGNDLKIHPVSRNSNEIFYFLQKFGINTLSLSIFDVGFKLTSKSNQYVDYSKTVYQFLFENKNIIQNIIIELADPRLYCDNTLIKKALTNLNEILKYENYEIILQNNIPFLNDLLKTKKDKIMKRDDDLLLKLLLEIEGKEKVDLNVYNQNVINQCKSKLYDDGLVTGEYFVDENDLINFNNLQLTKKGIAFLESKKLTNNKSNTQIINNTIETNPDKILKIFVIMPFDKQYNDLYEFAIKPSILENHNSCIRVDDAVGPRNIIKKIVVSLHNSDIVLAVLSGFNPNVFYELGVAHSLGNKTIMICEKGTKLPFDLQSYHVIFYENTIPGITVELKNEIKKAILSYKEWSTEANNPVQDFLPSKIELSGHTFSNSNIIIKTAGEKIKKGDALAVYTDSKVYKASNIGAENKKCSLFALESAYSDEFVNCVNTGEVLIPNSKFEIGKNVLLRANGEVSTDGSEYIIGNIIQKLGTATSIDTMLISIGNPVLSL